MDVGFLKELVNYHFWANDRIMRAVEAIDAEAYSRDLQSSFASIQATLAHLMTAEAIWLSRWTGEVIPPVQPEEIPSPASARERWLPLVQRLQTFGDGLAQEDLGRVYTVRHSSGKEFNHPLWEMIQHVANHGTYHRGQVVTLLRQVGATAPSTDLVHYYRSRSGQI